MDDAEAQTPLANLFTLGVRDLSRQRDFYRALGFPQVADDDDFAAFALRGAVLALFPAVKLAADGGGAQELGGGGIRFTIGLIMPDASEVDGLTERFRAAGGRITKEPTDAEFFAGRSAYVADPEGNFFEIVWAEPDNPVLAAAYRAAGLRPEPPS